MPYAVVQDVPTSWVQYERHAAPLLDPIPVGLIFHLAGPTEEGVRTIAVWEDVAAFERFHAERVLPALATLGGPSRPEPTTRDLHALHLAIGTTGQEAWASVLSTSPACERSNP